MYLRVNNALRPFNEAWATITYEPQYDVRRRMVMIIERWEIEGRVVLQGNYDQSEMTLALSVLDRDFSQPNPSLVFVEDDGVTDSFLRLRREDCFRGPYITRSSFPHNDDNIYKTGQSYSITFEAQKQVPGGSRSAIMEFSETLQKVSGGPEYVFVGGAINLPEKQVAREHAPYVYRQTGSAVGLYGWPLPPAPLWPQALLRTNDPVYVSPREYGRIDMYFETQWSYEFGSPFALLGYPHTSP